MLGTFLNVRDDLDVVDVLDAGMFLDVGDV